MSESNKSRFKNTIKDIDAVNAQDPNQEMVNGKSIAKELIYGIRMSEMLMETYPDAEESLRVAARCQHISRWSIPRENYPMDRKGYLLWRTKLKQFHGKMAGEIMLANGYSQEEIRKVDDFLNKRRLKTDPGVQALEDVICLVFLKYYFEAFHQKHQHEESKLIAIIQKTWNKMSEKGRQKALTLNHSAAASKVLSKALADEA